MGVFGEIYTDSVSTDAAVTLTWTGFKTLVIPWKSTGDSSNVSFATNAAGPYGFLIGSNAEYHLKANITVFAPQPVQLFFQFLSDLGNIPPGGQTLTVFGGNQTASLQKLQALSGPGSRVWLAVNLASKPIFPFSVSFYRGSFTIQDTVP